jgi:hypothetical protein
MKRLCLLFACFAACSGADSGQPDANADGVDAAVESPDAPLGPPALVINEVAAAGAPNDWFEVVNAGFTPVRLADYLFIDSGPIDDAVPFDDGNVLAPGAYFVQEVTDGGNGFKLGADEELHLFRIADGAMSDTVDWADGASPDGSSYARIPDITGSFQTVTPDTRGVPND